MNKKLFFSLVIITTLSIIQTSFGQNEPKLSRKVLLKLDPNETLWYNEYNFKLNLDAYKFAAITYNDKTDECTFVFNGERIAKTQNVFYLDLSKEKGYGFTYDLAGRTFVNIGGKVVQNANSYPVDFTITKTGKYAFSYYENEMWGIIIDGKKMGSYSYVNNINITDNGKYAFSFEENGSYFVKINTNISDPYEDIGNVKITNSGKYAYSFKLNELWYFNNNGSISKSYQNIGNIAINDNGKYAFIYEDNERWHINVNGKLIGSYEYAYDIGISDDGKYSFVYSEDGEYYYNINGEIASSWEDYAIMRNEHFCDRFKAIYKSENEEGILVFEGETIEEITSLDEQHFFYSDLNYEYVVIDGNQVGKSPALCAWYNKKNNSFVWNSLEGKELVVYEYKL